VPVAWSESFVGSGRRVQAQVGEPVALQLDPGGHPLGPFAARIDADGSAAAAAVLQDGSIALARREIAVNPITGAATAAASLERLDAPVRPAVLVLDRDRRSLFGGTPSGELAWWRLGAAEGGPPQIASTGSPITALTLLIGSRSLVVGHADGGVGVWFPVRQPDESFRLTRVRELPSLAAAVRHLAPSARDKGFLAAGDSGELALYYSTSRRRLWSGRAPSTGLTAVVYAPKADGALLGAPHRLDAFDIHSPHPEVSLGALFGRVWYEGHEGPAFMWQSSGATDDFEAKLSLTPLVFGTLKGTFYSLLLAIPLAVFGAMYTSQFTHPELKRYVKPTVEIMAALPSVVLGFLAGLWLAPRLERLVPAVLAMVGVLPLLALGTGYAWGALPLRWRSRLLPGTDAFIHVAVLALGAWACVAAAPLVETTFLGGDFQRWLLEATGLRYDPRNAVVVGIAMGFAVIPIIFSIAEDAFSNVPQNLISGSLALGASRWQTVTRLVLPTASPGIFSAVMIGFGRAVGETMIVLMATGNTPIMDWSPFNGFRTLSANIATEIPEAPQGGTLYRTLFLAALLLFLLTFAVNTAADLVRQRLRRRYAEL
jgi:phosphate transport system permease protein